MTVFVTTHYLDEAEYCHRLALIHAGRLAALGTTTELKQVFADRPIVEIRTPQTVRVMRELDGMPEVEGSSLFGTAVHAVLRPPEAVVPEAGEQPVERVAARLRDAGLSVFAIDPVEASLEDVFLDVVEKAARG